MLWIFMLYTKFFKLKLTRFCIMFIRSSLIVWTYSTMFILPSFIPCRYKASKAINVPVRPIPALKKLYDIIRINDTIKHPRLYMSQYALYQCLTCIKTRTAECEDRSKTTRKSEGWNLSVTIHCQLGPNGYSNSRKTMKLWSLNFVCIK